MKISIPIPAMYKRAVDRMDFYNPTSFIRGLQAQAIQKKIRPLSLLGKETEYKMQIRIKSSSMTLANNIITENRNDSIF